MTSSHPKDVELPTLYSSSPPSFWLDELVSEVPRMDSALCAQVDPELFFPPKGASTRPAKRICARCPEQQTCLEWALKSDQRFGIYGGLTAHQRRARNRGEVHASLRVVGEKVRENKGDKRSDAGLGPDAAPTPHPPSANCEASTA